MNCRQFEIACQSLLEGEPQPEAYTHLAACPHCRVLLDDLKALGEAGRILTSLGSEPRPALWGRIEAAALEEQIWVRPLRWPWFGLGEMLLPARVAFAGALAVVLLLAVSVVNYPPAQMPMAELDPPDPVGVAQGELVQDASYTERYQAHLENAAERVLAAEAPGTNVRALVAGPMKTVDRAIEQTQLQLESDPEDSLTREELRRLYQQKAAVLQAMADPVWYEEGR
jgi:hypothetical protein